jgi:hypothetical protein
MCVQGACLAGHNLLLNTALSALPRQASMLLRLHGQPCCWPPLDAGPTWPTPTRPPADPLPQRVPRGCPPALEGATAGAGPLSRIRLWCTQCQRHCRLALLMAAYRASCKPRQASATSSVPCGTPCTCCRHGRSQLSPFVRATHPRPGGPCAGHCLPLRCYTLSSMVGTFPILCLQFMANIGKT